MSNATTKSNKKEVVCEKLHLHHLHLDCHRAIFSSSTQSKKKLQMHSTWEANSSSSSSLLSSFSSAIDHLATKWSYYKSKWSEVYVCMNDKRISPSSFVSSSLSSTSSSSQLSSLASSPSFSSSAFSSNKQCYCKSQRRQDWEPGKEKRILMQKTKHEDWAFKYCLQVRKENLSIVAVVLVLAIWELIVVSEVRELNLKTPKLAVWEDWELNLENTKILLMFAYWVLPGQTILGWTSNNYKRTMLLSQGIYKWDFKTCKDCIFLRMAWFYN